MFSTSLKDTKQVIMTRKKKMILNEIHDKIKVRLDHKTIVTLRDLSKFDFWKERYPNATIIS